jgi:predicted phage-related endonuclease
MCYTKKQIDNRVRKLADIDAQIKALTKEADAIKKDLQTDMGEVEHVSGDKYKVNWTHVETPRFDSTAFAIQFPEVAAAWTKVKKSRRFSWSAI